MVSQNTCTLISSLDLESEKERERQRERGRERVWLNHTKVYVFGY